MKRIKVRNVKNASFYGMLKYSLSFVFMIFVAITLFIFIMTYLLVSVDEENLANILINGITQKYQNVESVSTELGYIMLDNIGNVDKNKFLEQNVKLQNDILVAIVLDKDGKVVNASKLYENFIGYDFSKQGYYTEAIKNNKTIISDPFIEYKTNKMSIAVAVPLIKAGNLSEILVTIVDPEIIKNDNLKNLEYYMINNKGDILFNSGDYNNDYYKDNILDVDFVNSGKGENSKTFFHKDKVNGRYVVSTIKSNESKDTFVIIQYYIFGNKILFNGIIIIFILCVIFIGLFIFLFAIKFSTIATKYINIFLEQVKKLASGNYAWDTKETYAYEEVNEIVGTFSNMAEKVIQREQELQVYNEELRAANDEVKDMLETINKNEYEKKEQYITIISTVLNLIEIKDEYTAGHSRSVTNYSQKITEKLNCDYGFDIDIEKVKVGSMLHDVGKISIDRDILNKPTKLTNEEFEIIKTHPSKGYYALKEIENLNDEREMVMYHHERYDGKGYPKGLKGEEIPIYARIICVADAFDAMTSDRPYRKGMAVEEAIDELIKNKGTQFEPLIVDAFVELLKEREYIRKL